MPQHSAGVLLFERTPEGVRVLLVHPGGPYWRGRDAGAWQIPKGAIEPHETPDDAARREAGEELGVVLTAPLAPLGQIRQSGGKLVDAFAVEQQVDADAVRSNLCELEWPPRSGRMQLFPEVDAARWMSLGEAEAMMLPSQRPLLERLRSYLASGTG